MLDRVSRPDYSIVIPAYDEASLIGLAIGALHRAMAAAPGQGELIVCDNASTDRTAQIARDCGAVVVHEPARQISRVRNTGARAARGRFLVFVDADTVVPVETLRAALLALRSGRIVGGGAAVAMPGLEGRLSRFFLRSWNAVSRARRLAAGSFLFCRADAFHAAGGFSEKVYASEEIWLSRRLARWGRARGLGFEILDAPPVETSPRKAEWYPQPVLLAVALSFALLPLLVRSRRFCWLWYQRPGRAGRSAPPAPPGADGAAGPVSG